MKTKKYFIVPVLALLFTGCQKNGSIQPATGEEVMFSATLGDDTTTRTIYGKYNSGDMSWPIYWVSGDAVIVASPECANGGNPLAKYTVYVENENQNYADYFTKVGERGIQWGSSSTGFTFYSVYPAGQAEFDDNYSTVTLEMPTEQECTFVRDDSSIAVYPDMDACFMYAKTTGVYAGETVNLKYIPFSTAIRFTLQGPSSGSAIINSITFSAPSETYIAGKFEIDLDGVTSHSLPTPEAVDNSTTNSVTVSVKDSNDVPLILAASESAEVFIFFLLDEDKTVNGNGDWTIQITTGSGTSTKNLGSGTLRCGYVNNLGTLPNLGSDSGYTYDEQENTYIVYDANGLLTWNKAANTSPTTKINCTLIANIDLSNHNFDSDPWLQVGTYSNYFYNGTFEGNGYTITGLTVNENERYIGLIACLASDGKVQNLKLDEVSISGSGRVGGVVGQCHGTVTNCSVSGSVYGSAYYVGGVVGRMYSGTVANCSVSGSVEGGHYVGGVVGQSNTGNSSYMIACYSTGDLSGIASDYIGGVVGANSNISNNENYVVACYWSGYTGRGSYYNGDVNYVDGTSITWQTAVNAMNDAIDEWNTTINTSQRCEWKYYTEDEDIPPTLVYYSSNE